MSTANSEALENVDPTVYYVNAPSPYERIKFCGFTCDCQKRQYCESVADLPDYEYLTMLGSGRFADVHLGRSKSKPETVAIKRISFINQYGDNVLHEIASEFDIVSNIVHPNIVRYYDFFTNPVLKNCYIVMEYLFYGDLRTNLNYHIREHKRFEDWHILNFIVEIVRGVEFLNANDLVHCDLKPENIMIGERGCVKICDFSLAHYDCDIRAPISSSTIYLAPELFLPDVRPNEGTEVWAIGVILYELCTLRHPFGDFMTTAQYLEKANILQYPPLIGRDEEIVKLLEIMLQVYPENRCRLSYILVSKPFRPI